LGSLRAFGVLNEAAGIELVGDLDFVRTVLDLTDASSDQIDTIFSAMDSWAEIAAPRSPAIILGDSY
jgi:hypothetical protein